ncbi:Trifunctional NAD biosynthesis/regulator protein NadR [Raoultella terrigena]|uniref:Trifunctional NAD biosynthesis/regulator protein NadR n=1 Tax=Raoultella terrigena TaxID=577 RepID=A0A4U9D849_RAOTE|nr:Trifunctional NAD biosynthesis/regulator protein NadR [Raoultella terrigena]
MCHRSTISKPRLSKKAARCRQVAEASGMTKGYLSQLLNAKIKSPSAQKLEALHRFLGLEFPRRQKSVGVVFGKFYPLHTGHIYLIQRGLQPGRRAAYHHGL